MKKKITLIILTFILPKIILAQWLPVVNISPNATSAGLNENMGPCLAVSGDTIHTVWSDKQGSNYVLYYTHSLDTGNTWSNAIPITNLTGRATMPVIAVSGKNVHVVWMDSLNGIRASYYIRSLDGGTTWGQQVCMDVNTIFWPGVACHGSMVLISLDKGTFGVNTEVWLTRSFDNGTTWGAQQQISNANGRSEDQAMATDGSNIHLTWNDNRSGTMQIYYRHSNDFGATWGPEAALFLTASYTTMVSLYGPYVDVAVGNQGGGNFDVWLAQSSDTGATWVNPNKQLTTATTGEAYPYMVRNGMNLYVIYRGFSTGVGYMSSSDGGTSWTQPINLGTGGQPFIALTGNCMLHAIWPDANKIQYSRNRISSCSSTTAINYAQKNSGIRLFPNPAKNIVTITSEKEFGSMSIYNSLGEVLYTRITNETQEQIDLSNFSAGIYFLKTQSQFIKLIKE